jgi:hypothetical protein
LDMSDILFRCPKCQASYAVEDTDAGQDFTCASCGNCASVPTPDIQMICGSCRCSLVTSGRYRGETFNCPNCDGKVFIPKVSLKDQSSYPPPRPPPTDEPRSFSRREPQLRPARPVIPRWVMPVVVLALLAAGGAYVCFKKPVQKQVERPAARAIIDEDPTKEADYLTLKCGLMALCSMQQLDKTNYAGGFAGLEYTQRQFPVSEFSSVFIKSNYMASCSRCTGTGEIRTPCPACKGAGECAFCKASGTCPKCKGAGKTSVPCAACKGTGKCDMCGGMGKVDTFKTVTKEVPVEGLTRTSHMKGTKEMTRTVRTQERETITCPTCHGARQCPTCYGSGTTPVLCSVCSGSGQCPRCKGGGKCLKCAGVGSTGSKCTECSGTGLVISRDRIQQNRDQVLPKIQELINIRQSREPQSESLQAIVDSLRKMDLSNAVMKVDAGELFFFRTFEAKEQNAATTNNAATAK